MYSVSDMNIFAVIGAGIAAAAISVILRQYNKEYGLYIGLAVSVIIFLYILGCMKPVFSLVDNLIEISGTSGEYVGILIKSLAICYITQLASDCCRDCGETAIASRIDFAGKIALLLISIHLFEAILGIVKELINAP